MLLKSAQVCSEWYCVLQLCLLISVHCFSESFFLLKKKGLSFQESCLKFIFNFFCVNKRLGAFKFLLILNSICPCQFKLVMPKRGFKNVIFSKKIKLVDTEKNMIRFLRIFHKVKCYAYMNIIQNVSN